MRLQTTRPKSEADYTTILLQGQIIAARGLEIAYIDEIDTFAQAVIEGSVREDNDDFEDYF